MTGVVLNALYWLLAVGIDRWGPWTKTVASGVAYALTSVLAYFFHRHFTFRSRNPIGAEAIRFVVATGTGMTVALLLPHVLPRPPWFGYAAVCVVAPVVNFLMYRMLVYAQSSKD